MRLLLALIFLSMWSCTLNPAFAANWPRDKVKLLVVIVIDQFRSDFLSRYSAQFSDDGFRALTKSGAFYPLAEYDILQSMTGPGHATVLTGSYPYQSGIPINDWYDQTEHRPMYCVDDALVKTVGLESGAMGSSPRNLVGSTVGDELKNAGLASKTVTVAIKDRAAVLLGGHRADLALWLDGKPKRWVSSTYYRKDGKLPAWTAKLNPAAGTCDLDKPCSSDITAEAFIAALEGEKLGLGTGTDLLAVSFSGHDIAGHKYGPNSAEIKAMTLAEDKAIARMRAAVAKQVGLKNVVFVLTGDHGVAPVPEETGFEYGRIEDKSLNKKINDALVKQFGKAPKGDWIAYADDFNYYIDEEQALRAKVDLAKIQVAIKNVLLGESYFAQVLTRDEMMAHLTPPGVFERRARKTYYPGRSGHVIAVQKPFFIPMGKNLATHMTGYSYDRYVPLILSGVGIKPGLYAEKAEVVDIAPTLAFLLGIVPPALSEGRVLSEALAKGP